MDTGLAGKAALVTGGGTGIGLAIASALADEGVDVAVVSRTSRPEAVERLREKGVRASWFGTDVSSEADIVSSVASIVAGFGRIDLIVSNAVHTHHEPITRITASNWETTLGTNLSGCVFLCREALRHMIPTGRGSVLVIGSTAAHVPLYKESAYRASKAGLKAIVEVMAIETAPYGIRVNLLTPGAFPTALLKDLPDSQISGRYFPLGRMGRFEEIGAAAVFLLSDTLSGYTTGAELVVDGGYRLRPMDLYSSDELRELNTGDLPRT